MSIPAVIFSRDRACQLDLLLSSLATYSNGVLGSIAVLWKASQHGGYDEGYGICMREHPEVNFIPEDGLTYQVRSLLGQADLVTFFTDDDVLFRVLDDQLLVCMDRDDVICFSLRLGRNTSICYPHNRTQRIPQNLDGNTLLWDWRSAELDFGYPLSIDGHILRSADLLPLLETRHFSSPNLLEDVLMSQVRQIGRPLMAAYGESRLVSIPANIVNETHTGNRHGSQHTAADLNERYLAGARIDLAKMTFDSVAGAHHELPYVFS